MEDYIERLPNWARWVLALPLALASFFLVHLLFRFIIPDSFLIGSIWHMNDAWINQFIILILIISAIKYLLSIVAFMIVFYSLVPINKSRAVLIVSAIWSLLLIVMIIMDLHGLFSVFPWPALNSIISSITAILFLCIYAWRVYKSKPRKGKFIDKDGNIIYFD